jgi:hypothetical protein
MSGAKFSTYVTAVMAETEAVTVSRIQHVLDLVRSDLAQLHRKLDQLQRTREGRNPPD